jgi:hypothetical protein
LACEPIIDLCSPAKGKITFDSALKRADSQTRAMTLYLFIAVVVLNLPVYAILFGAFFGGSNGFWEAFRLFGRGEWRAALAGDYENQQFAKLQFLLFAISCVLMTAASHFVIAKFLFGFEDPWAFLR